MKTKLVYVLTCAPDATYIEQALMAVWSARYHNPDAHIVLMVDDKTDALLTGKRGEILNYITEKIVVPIEDETLSPMYRSRWIKTQVRQMIEGDFLFVDSDTICQRPLNEIDGFDCEVGAVYESHLLIKDFYPSLYRSAKIQFANLGMEVDDEKEYFSSGVLYVKDTDRTHRLYALWHQNWQISYTKGVPMDQPSLAQSNRELGRIIMQIPDTYNCILFTQPLFVREAHILHIAAYRNPAYIFSNRMLNYVREKGIGNEWLLHVLLHPCATMMPFEYALKHSSIRQRVQWTNEISAFWKGYGRTIANTYADFPSGLHLDKIIHYLLRHGYTKIAVYLYITEYRMHLRKKQVKVNACHK